MNERKLSEAYLERMKELLGEEELTQYIKSFDREPQYGLRVNPLKTPPENFLSMAGFPLSPVPWIPEGFYYDREERPAKSPYYYAGLFYLQEPSAMTPASLLPVLPGDRVLDLCAAPGGKSTALGAKLKGKGVLVSNDLSSSRAKSLLKNLELWGIENICVTCEAPEKLADAWGPWFHKIIVDAPCSGEGMFRRDGDMIKSYGERGPEHYAGLQKELMEQAVRLLVPGGFLLYSTCTFSPCENEGVLTDILNRCESMELVKLEPFEGAVNGMGLDGCLRLYPHRLKGEGHFIALLRKKMENAGEAGHKSEVPSSKEAVKRPDLNTVPRQRADGQAGMLPELLEFLSHIRRSFEASRLLIKNNRVYYLPEDFTMPEKLRYLRTGLYLGELKKNRFEPGQALAMALKAEEFDQTLTWGKSDGRVIRYLKGETVELTKEEGELRGWCLVTVDGFPLGFAKGCGRSLKNKYYPGWRWQ